MSEVDPSDSFRAAARKENIPAESGPHYLVSEQSSASGPFFLQSGYDAANNSPSRGYLYWPSLNSRHELSSYSDAEIRRRVHWLYANFGFARRIVNGLAKLIGVMTPVPNTGQGEWDDQAFESFLLTAGSEEIFDASGKFDYFTVQPQWNRARFKDGRSLGVFSETEGGFLQMAFYDAFQISNPRDRVMAKDCEQGVYLDRMGKHIAWSVQDGDDAKAHKRIDRRDGLYLGRHESYHAVHGISILAHCVTNMVDVVETRGFWKHKIKDASRTGLVRERELPTAVVGTGGIGSTVIKQLVKTPDGKVQEINWEAVMAGAAVPQLEPGESLRVISDTNPSDQNRAFEIALLEDCIFGADLPPAALYYVSGITGPGIRYTMEDINRWVLLEHLWQAKKCHQIYTKIIARDIHAGRLADPGVAWWRPHYVAYLGQPSMTIDAGRDARMSVTHLASGLTTWESEWGKRGQFWKHAIWQRAKEVAYAKSICAEEGLDYKEVFPDLAGTPSSAPEEEQEHRPDDDPEDEPKPKPNEP